VNARPRHEGGELAENWQKSVPTGGLQVIALRFGGNIEKDPWIQTQGPFLISTWYRQSSLGFQSSCFLVVSGITTPVDFQPANSDKLFITRIDTPAGAGKGALEIRRRGIFDFRALGYSVKETES
jgi:hypothetical protein